MRKEDSSKEKKQSNWGGKREGAGRPGSGKKQYSFYITEEENTELRRHLKEMRGEWENWA